MILQVGRDDERLQIDTDLLADGPSEEYGSLDFGGEPRMATLTGLTLDAEGVLE